MKKKGQKPIIKSKVIIEGNTENSFMKNKLPKIIHDLEKFTKRELKVILSPSLNVSTTNIFKNFEPLPKETPRKNLRNIVSSTPYCGRYGGTQFTVNSSLPSPIHVGSFNRNRYNRKVTNSTSSESSSVVYVGTEVDNGLNIRKDVKEEPKSCNLAEVIRSVETSRREQSKTDEAHVHHITRSPGDKQKMLVEASRRADNSQNQVKQQELSRRSAQRSARDASFSKSSSKKKKAEVSLKSTMAATRDKESAKDRAQSSPKVDKRRKQQLDASDQDSLEAVEIAGSRLSHPKTDNRNVSIDNDGRFTRSVCRRLPERDAKKQFASEESGVVPSKINENKSRLLRCGGLNGALGAAEEPKDFGRSGIEPKQTVDKPIEVQCRTVEVGTEMPPLAERDAGRQPDKEESSVVSLKDDERRSRYVTSRSKRPDGTFGAAEEPDDIGNIREVNPEPKQMVGEGIEVQRKTVQANTQTSPPSNHYTSGKRRTQNGFKGSFKDVLIEMERQARLKSTASVPAWTQTSGLTLGDNPHADNGAVGLDVQIIQEIAAKKTQMMCNITETNPIRSEAAKADTSSAATGPKADESGAAARVCKTPLFNNSARRPNEGRTVGYATESFRSERAKINKDRLISFENLINKLEAKALLAQEIGEDSDSAISFNSSMSSNRRFRRPKKSLNAHEKLEFSRCSSRHNKSRASAKKNLNSIIEKLIDKGTAGRNVAKKSTQTSCLGVELLQDSPNNRKPENVAPSLRRSVMKQSCERRKNIRNKSSIRSWEHSVKESEPSPAPNIYDSIREGNVADCLNFSALSDACFAEYLHKPWRCPEVSSHTDTFPRLSFIRSEAAIAADALHEFDDDSDDESSDFEVNRTRTNNNNVSLAPPKVSASKGKPNRRRYSKCKARKSLNRKSKSSKKASLSGWKVQNNLDDGIEAEAEAERNVPAEILRGKCSLGRQRDVSEIRQDEVVNQTLRSSRRNLASNSETAESWIRNKTLDGIDNTASDTLTSKPPMPARVNSITSIPNSRNDKRRKSKRNIDTSLIISQQTPQKINEGEARSSLTRAISSGKRQVSPNLPANKSKTEMPSSSFVRLHSCSVTEEDENLEPATSKGKRRKRNRVSKNLTSDSFSKKKAYNTSYPLADISEINIIQSSGTSRPLRARKTRIFEMPEELEKDGFVFSQENRRSCAKSRLSTQKTKKRVSKKSSILEDQRLTLQETNTEGALSPIKENDVNEDVVTDISGPTIVNENRVGEMPPPRMVPPKRKTLAVKNGEVSVDSGFETSNAGRKIGKTSRGCLKRKVISSDAAGFSDSERDFRVSEQDSNVLSRISSPIHHTFDSMEPDGNSARTDMVPIKSSLRACTRQKRSSDLPLNKYKKFGDAYMYKLYNTPDKQCEVGYLRLESGEETRCCVFGDYSSVALAVKSGTGFVTTEDKSFPSKIDDWFHVFKGQKYTIRNTSHDQYLKLIYMKLQ